MQKWSVFEQRCETLCNSVKVVGQRLLFSSETCESPRLETPARHSVISLVLPVPAFGQCKIPALIRFSGLKITLVAVPWRTDKPNDFLKGFEAGSGTKQETVMSC